MKYLTSLVFLLAIGAIFYTYYNNAPTKPVGNKTGFLKTEQEFRNKLAEFRIEQDKVNRRMALLNDKKAETVALLKDKGVTSTSNLEDSEVKLAVNDLKRSVADIKQLQDISDQYQKGIVSIESMLKKIERDRITTEVAITDEKSIEISKIIMDLDEKLGLKVDENILEEERLRELLDLELGGDEG